MASRSVLVVGDLMLDRSWVMSARIGETVQAHHDVVPTKRVAPGANDTRLGGAGATASAIAQDESFKVHLLASYDLKDTGWFENLGLRKVPANSKDIVFHSARAFRPLQTTLKFRVYQRNPPGPPRLRFRFDQDPIEPDNAAAIPVSLPSSLDKHHFEALVVADFQKGMISPALIEELCKNFGQIEWFVDSKNASLLEGRNAGASSLADVKGTLFLNRTEFLRFREHFCGHDSSASGDALFRGDGGRKLLLTMMKEVLEKLKRDGFVSWRLVVKLDRDGAAAAWGANYAIGAPEEAIDDAAGICAGDFFLAGWIRRALAPLQPGASDEEKYDACLKEAIQSGTAWVRASEEKFWTSEAYIKQRTDIARPGELARDAINREKVKITSKGIIDEEVESIKNLLQYPSALTRPNSTSTILDLSQARLYMKKGEFLTINPYFAEDIRSFMDRLADHVRHGEQRRPMNCVIWAPPGSGKSYLARQMEKELEVQNLKVVFGDINVSSYTSRRDVIEALARASEEHTRGSLILIDELSSEIDGEPFGVIPALLGPLWDGVVVWDGRDHKFDRPVTFLLADSGGGLPLRPSDKRKIQCAGDLLGYIRENLNKGPDFVSRINGPLLTFPNASSADTEEKRAYLQLDRMYLIGSLIHRSHSHVAQMQRGVLDLLVYAENLSPRQLEYLIEALRPTDGELRNQDLVGIPLAVWKNVALDRPKLGSMDEAIVQLRV